MLYLTIVKHILCFCTDKISLHCSIWNLQPCHRHVLHTVFFLPRLLKLMVPPKQIVPFTFLFSFFKGNIWSMVMLSVRCHRICFGNIGEGGSSASVAGLEGAEHSEGCRSFLMGVKHPSVKAEMERFSREWIKGISSSGLWQYLSRGNTIIGFLIVKT